MPSASPARIPSVRFAAFGIAICAIVFALLAPHVPVHAQVGFGLEETVKQINGGSNFAQDPKVIIGRIISAALGLVGIVFFLLMLYAGFLWMTARGNEKTAAQAKEIIISAIIGLVIVAGAYAITNTIFTGLTTATPGEGGGQAPNLRQGQ